MLGVGGFLNTITRTIKTYRMRIFIILSVFCFPHLDVISQTVSMNQLDSIGRKDGKWTVYYNSKGKEVSDSAQAIYYRYTWYEHGKNIQEFDWAGKGDNVIASDSSRQNDAAKVLHGEYKITDKKGNIKSIHVFDEGEYVSYRSFYSSGALQEYCNFTNLFFEERHSYCKRVYSKTGRVKFYYMRDQPNDEDIYDQNPARFERSFFDSTSVTNKRVIGDSIFLTATSYIGAQPKQQEDWFFMNEGGGERPILHGVYLSYYITGQKKEEGFYHYNKKVGDWKQWNIDGKEIKDYPDYNELNKTDKNGEKTGWWIMYLDANLKVLEDSIGATHCMYNYYTGKFYHYRFGNGLGSKKFPVHFPVNDSLKLGNFVLLNGDYTTYYEDGKIRAVLSVSNGVLTEYKQYFEDGKLHLHFIYSTDCGAPIRFCLKQYDKEGKLKYDSAGLVPQDYRKEYR